MPVKHPQDFMNVSYIPRLRFLISDNRSMSYLIRFLDIKCPKEVIFVWKKCLFEIYWDKVFCAYFENYPKVLLVKLFAMRVILCHTGEGKSSVFHE